jgi:predicted aminopeptidase
MFFRFLFAFSMFGLLSGCLSGCNGTYYLKSAYHQMKLMNARVDVSEILKREDLKIEDRKKILIAQEAREFAEKVVGLKHTRNYSSFVQLDQPYVNYTLSAAPKWKLEHHQWDFLVVGKVPYKGFFSEAEGKAAEQTLIKQGFDTYLRGVSAYSTLGWFRDPLLSSMMRYSEYDLVNLVIHETVHATLYIKSSADFNERMASFLGNKGTEAFYLKKEGPQSATLVEVKADAQDDELFSDFISKELKDLAAWYEANTLRDEAVRSARLAEINARFKSELQPKMKGKGYSKFGDRLLNNASLNVYKTYYKDHSDFEKLWQKSGADFKKFLQACKSLESEDNPEEALKKLVL